MMEKNKKYLHKPKNGKTEVDFDLRKILFETFAAIEPVKPYYYLNGNIKWKCECKCLAKFAI
jgi:hypothetical protein